MWGAEASCAAVHECPDVLERERGQELQRVGGRCCGLAGGMELGAGGGSCGACPPLVWGGGDGGAPGPGRDRAAVVACVGPCGGWWAAGGGLGRGAEWGPLEELGEGGSVDAAPRLCSFGGWRAGPLGCPSKALEAWEE